MRTTRWMILSAIFATGTFSLGGCAVDTNSGRILSCPPLVEYSAEEQRKAADEIRNGKAGTLSKMVKDYGVLRKACRV